MTFRNDNNEIIQFDGEFAFTKQALSFINFKLIGDYSINFKIQNSSNNRKILGYHGINNINAIISTKNIFNLIDTSGNIFTRGYIVVNRDGKDVLECYFISGNSNWFSLLNQNITSFAYQDKDYIVPWGQSVIQNRATKRGIIFPMLDVAFNGNKLGNTWIIKNSASSGYPISNNDNGLTELIPAFYLHSLVDEIALNTGVKFNGSLIDDPVYNSIVILPKSTQLKLDASLVNDSKLKVSGTISVSGLPGTVTFPSQIQFANIDEQGNIASYSLVNFRYRCARKGTYKVTFHLIITQPQAYEIQIFQSGAPSPTTVVYPMNSGKSVGIYNCYGFVNCDVDSTLEAYIQPDSSTGLPYQCDGWVKYELCDIITPFQQNDTNTSIANDPYINPSGIVPEILSSDVVKFLCFYFGCICSYDQYSKTITLNMMDRISDSEDWSSYYVSDIVDYQTGQGLNNYVATLDPKEENLIAYNNSIKKKYGWGNIQTDYSNPDKTPYTIPFAPVDDPLTKLGMTMPYVKYYDVKQDTNKTVSVTSVTNNAGIAQFQATNSFIIGEVIEVITTVYQGFGIVSSSSGSHFELHGVSYTFTATGSATKSDYSDVEGECRLLLVMPDYTISSAGLQNSITIKRDLNLVTSQTSSTICIGWFDKLKINDDIDNFNQSLAVDTVGQKTYNIPISENYLRTIKNIFNSPLIKVKMILPSDVFASFNFQKYIYLNTGRHLGLYIIESIKNYVDCLTECEVWMYKKQ